MVFAALPSIGRVFQWPCRLLLPLASYPFGAL